jgi:hypothetical protein
MKEILNAIEALGKYLGLDPAAVGILLVLPLGLLYWRFRYYQNVLGGSRGLTRVRESLEGGDWRSAYFGRLRRALSWVDCKLGPSPWSADGYSFALTLAFIYPVAAMFIIWLATGQNTSGIAALLQEHQPVWRRILLACSSCAVAYFGGYRFARSSGRRQLINLAIAAIFYVFTLTFASAYSVVFTGVAVIAVALALATIFIPPITGHFVYFFIGMTLALSVTAVSLPSSPQYMNTQLSFTFIFLVLLPLINSIFDWLSLAATRGLLKNMAERDDAPALHVLWNAAVGLILGVVLLAGLAATVTAALQTANLLSQSHGGPEYFDLAGRLHSLRADPANPAVWWVYFTLFSTMLPTVFHAAIASASFVAWRLPESWKRHWLSLLDDGIKEDHPVLVGMAWRLTLMDAATVLLAALSAAILAWLLFWLMPYEGHGLLWICERVAEWLGAAVQI